MAVPEKPITRLEQYWDGILQKIEGEGGGSSVIVEPLSVSENGTYDAPDGSAYSPVHVNVPNPNFIETIKGTLGNPWGNTDLSTLRLWLINNDATAFIDFTSGTDLVRILLRYDNSSNIYFSGYCGTFFGALTNSYYITYTRQGAIQMAKKYSNTGAASDLSSSLATTLTIIHHPMPEA